MGVRPLLFFTLDGLAACISVPLWILVGWWFGHNLDTALKFAMRLQSNLLATFIVIVSIYYLWKRHKRRKEERLLKSQPASPAQIVASQKTEEEQEQNLSPPTSLPTETE